jgi:HK97 family phage major capsid protein
MPDGMRDKLKRVQSQLSEVRSQVPAKEREVEAAKEAFANKEDLQADVKITETKEFLDAQSAVRELGTLKDQQADLEKAEKEIVAMFGDTVARGGGGLDPRSGNGFTGSNARGWDARAMLDASKEYGAARSMGVFQSEAKFGTLMLGQVANRETAMQFIARGGTMQADTSVNDIPAATPGPYGTPPAGIAPDYRGIIPYRVRQLSLLDMIPAGTTDSNSVEYVQVSAIPFGAAETAEFAAKPQVGFATEDATAPVRTIAAWIKMARQAMDDQAGVVSIINALLPYEVRRRIEGQILAGDGTGQNLRGILNTSGIGAPAAVAGDNAADAVLRAMTVIMLSDRDPNFVAMNPLTRQNLLLLRSQSVDLDTTDNPQAFQGQYLYGSPGTLAAPTIWGLSITPSRVINQNNPLVGDSTGATILVREGVNIKTSDSDQDDFIKNRVTLLAETRLAFPVWYPTAFCEAAIPS